MKQYKLLVAAIFLPVLTAQVHAAADVLEARTILRISGTIRQEAGQARSGTKVLPITIANVLSVLGIPVVPSDLKNLRYCTDVTTNSYVIAETADIEAGSGTPLATVLHLGTPNVDWQGMNPIEVGADTSASGFNTAATGAWVADYFHYHGNKMTMAKLTGLLAGELNSVQSVINLNILDVGAAQ